MEGRRSQHRTTKFVQQKNDTDCVTACLAMMSGINYDIIARYLKENHRKIGYFSDADARNCLQQLGYLVKQTDGLNSTVPAIMFVKSLNRSSSWHAIYWDGRSVYDPNRGSKADAGGSDLATYQDLPDSRDVLLTISAQQPHP